MLRISLTIFLALTAWIHPLNAVSAFAEQPLENPYFINYELHREIIKSVRGETIESVRNEQRADDGRGLLQPEQKLQPGNNKPIQKIDETKRTQKILSNQIPSEVYSGRNYPKEEVIELIKSYSAQYGIRSETPLCIAKLESGYNQFSKNKSSSASGVYQYLAKTFAATDEGKAGRSVFDPDANVKAAIKYMASRKSAKPWTVAKQCPPIQTIN